MLGYFNQRMTKGFALQIPIMLAISRYTSRYRFTVSIKANATKSKYVQR